jgi:Tol biopolymer transport system component
LESTSADEQHRPAGAITFLRGGQIWIADNDGRNERVLIKTSGNIKDYLFSQDLQYLAYHKTAGRGVGFFVILNTEKNRIEHERKFDAEKEAVYLIKWVSKSKLLFDSVALKTEHGAMGVICEYDIEYGEEDSGKVNNIIDRDSENTLEVYYNYKAGKRGMLIDQLHLSDLKSKSDKVIYSVDRGLGGVSIQEPKISNTKKYVAFIHCCSELWIYDMSKERADKYYSGWGPISWSPNDHYILFYTGQDKATILNVQNLSSLQTISGKSFTWHTDDHLLYEKNENIYRYDVISEKSEILIKKAFHPTYLASYSNGKKSTTFDSYDNLEKKVLSDKGLEQHELSLLDKKQLWLLRNTVFARHGREFSHAELQAWFKTKSWYKVNPNYSDNLLTENDKANVSALSRAETTR